MISEMYIEGQRVDVTTDISSLLNFAIDDIRDFSERSTTWSKTIVLPGTKNNNLIFGSIFETGVANDYNPAEPNVGVNFNASKSAACIIFQDNLQTFNGVMRLLQVNVGSMVEYEVAVFGTLFSLNVALTGALLTDLDFSEYNHIYNETEVVDSWDNTPGSGYYYPLIDYGTYSSNKHDWDIRTFRPALYVKEYIDKIFTAAGFRYDCDLFETARFKGLIVPHNQKQIFKTSDDIVRATVDTTYTLINGGLSQAENIRFDTFIGNSFTIDGNDEIMTYTGVDPIYVNIDMFILGNYSLMDSPDELTINFYKNSDVILTRNYPNTGGSVSQLDDNFNIYSLLLETSDTIRVEIKNNNASQTNTFVELSQVIFNIVAQTPSVVVVGYGSDIDMNAIIPKNVRQIDFLVSIVKLFNLYIYGDKFDDTLIYIKPYIDFYDTDSANAVDWTYKLDRQSTRKIKPLSEINAKIYYFNYAEDSDYYNDLYKKRYGQGYGSYIFDTQYEFASETQRLNIIFAPTVLLGYDGEDKIYSTIFKRTGSDSAPVEENIDSVIRILQTKKITGVTSWDIKDGSDVLDSVTDYGYAGHFDDPDDIGNDLNFGATSELFFDFVTGDLSINQFNVYWSPYMAETTNKDSKLLIGMFYLKPKDIFDLDFSKYINIDGVLYRLNKISDYNTTTPSTCGVELLKVINTIY